MVLVRAEGACYKRALGPRTTHQPDMPAQPHAKWNEIVVFGLQGDGRRPIAGLSEPKLDEVL